MTPHDILEERPTATRTATTVGDVMHVGVLSCPAETPIADVAALMAEHNVHAIVVEGLRRGAAASHLSVWGVVSDLDLVGRMDALDAWSATAGQMAATPAIVVDPGEALTEATRLMHAYDVHHLLVVDPADRRPIGVVSTLDVIRVLARRRVRVPTDRIA